MKKEKTKSQLMRQADKLYSAYWRNKIPFCERCGRRENLQLAHIISRDCRKLRYDHRNKFILCYSCHFTFHRKPLEFTMFVEKKKGRGASKRLIRESNNLAPLGKDYYQKVIDKYNCG